MFKNEGSLYPSVVYSEAENVTYLSFGLCALDFNFLLWGAIWKFIGNVKGKKGRSITPSPFPL